MESEQSLLGAILINNEALHTVAEFLQPEHFFEPIHKDIYDIARTLITSGKVANPVTQDSSARGKTKKSANRWDDAVSSIAEEGAADPDRPTDESPNKS
jgi:replicative DNA helicase